MRDDEVRDIPLNPAVGEIKSAESLGDIDLQPKESEELLRLEAAETADSGQLLESVGAEAFEAVELGPCSSVTSTQNPPFSAVALLRINKGENARRGTGFFIRPGILLTAGHNLVRGGVPADSIDVMTAMNGGPVGKYFRCRTFRASPEYLANPSPENDYGVVFVGRDLGVGHFGAVPPGDADDAFLRGKPVRMIGYPLANLRQVHCAGAVGMPRANILPYNVRANAGSSGSPVFLSVDDPRIVAIHVQGTVDGPNFGTRLTAAKVTQIRRWIVEAGGA